MNQQEARDRIAGHLKNLDGVRVIPQHTLSKMVVDVLEILQAMLAPKEAP